MSLIQCDPKKKKSAINQTQTGVRKKLKVIYRDPKMFMENEYYNKAMHEYPIFTQE